MMSEADTLLFVFTAITTVLSTVGWVVNVAWWADLPARWSE